MITILLLAIFLTMIFGIASGIDKDARTECVRQEVFRIRQRMYDRIISGELKLEDPNVNNFVTYLHAIIQSLEDWSIVELIRRFYQYCISKEDVDAEIKWMHDPRFQDEVKVAMYCTVQGFYLSSFYVKALWAGFRLLAIPLWIYAKTKGTVKNIKEAMEEKAVMIFATTN